LLSNSFDKVLGHVLGWEGTGLAHNATESFRTFSGINEKAYPAWPGWKKLDKPALMGETAKAMLMDELVKEFYLGLWNETKAAESGVDQDYFDTTVLQGPRLALRLLCRMHNMLSDEILSPDAPRDAVMFKIKQFNMQVRQEIRTGVYRALRQSHLIGLVEANPKFEIYLWGWIRRARGDVA